MSCLAACGSFMALGLSGSAPALVGGYHDWTVNIAVVLTTVVTVALSVLLHYEGLAFLSRGMARLSQRHRRRLLRGIFGVLALHVAEIWVFGISLFVLLSITPGFGSVQGVDTHSLFDHVYFSAVTYSTLGFGDVIPVGPVRFLVGTEALTGFVLITWSASFTFLQMERYWRHE